MIGGARLLRFALHNVPKNADELRVKFSNGGRFRSMVAHGIL